jgi:SAM-dependent methyltransferase
LTVRRCPHQEVRELMDEGRTLDATIDVQEQFWDRWNVQNRMAPGLDEYQQRLAAHAHSVIADLGPSPKIIEIGCGTGWLSQAIAPLGSLFGVDLSGAAVEAARARCADATFQAGDFLTMPISGEFDVALSADTLAHVPDQRAFIDRVATLLSPGGHLVLMSQNSFVWRRSSHVARADQPGYVRHWPSLNELRLLLRPRFDVLHAVSLAPGGGDVGILRWLNGRWGWGVLSRTLGRAATAALYEKLMLGREIAVLARLRST